MGIFGWEIPLNLEKTGGLYSIICAVAQEFFYFSIENAKKMCYTISVRQEIGVKYQKSWLSLFITRKTRLYIIKSVKEKRYSMKFEIINVITPEVHCALNPIRPEDRNKVAIDPQFKRNIVQVPDNKDVWIVDVILNMVGTEEKLSPMNINVRTRGIFKVEGLDTEQDKKVFNLSATEVIFPYLRSTVATVTGAMGNPLVLPAVPTAMFFPEDRDLKEFDVPNQPDSIQS